jgi:hypothetical protein
LGSESAGRNIPRFPRFLRLLGVITPSGLPVSGIVILREGVAEARSPRLEFQRAPILHIALVERLLQRLLQARVDGHLRAEADGGAARLKIVVERGPLYIVRLVWEAVVIGLPHGMTVGAGNRYGRRD